MLIRIFPDKEVFYNTELCRKECDKQLCRQCPLETQPICTQECQRLAFRKLHSNIQELIDLLCKE